MTEKVLWSGRFKEVAAEDTLAFTSSLAVDKRLARYDVLGSLAHAKMLAKQGIITPSDGDSIAKGLKDILAMIDDGTFLPSGSIEDVHSYVEFLLISKVKDAGARLHTARSRNDQVATDVRMFMRDATLDTIEAILCAERSLVERAKNEIDTIMPGFTHVQHAQPVTLAHHLMAHAFRLERDAGRLIDSFKRLDICPLGSAALAGTTYAIDRTYTAQLLAFNAPTSNSMDSVSDRDFAAEYIFSAALCGVHLSSLCEELVYWTSPEFGFAEMDDRYATGSSIMPQKKNSDVAELIRGRSAGGIAGVTEISSR